MIDPSHGLPLTRQARILALSRSSLYYRPRPVSEADLAIMRRNPVEQRLHEFDRRQPARCIRRADFGGSELVHAGHGALRMRIGGHGSAATSSSAGIALHAFTADCAATAMSSGNCLAALSSPAARAMATASCVGLGVLFLGIMTS